MIDRIVRRIKRILFRPRIKIEQASGKLVHLGTAYGGKTFVERPELFGATIVSAGIGEDVSFDVEFAKRYGATMLLVDPTPRSIAYYDGLMGRIGRESTTHYGTSGCLPLESYDLSGVGQDQFRLIPKALWIEETRLKFYLPKNPEHVSHSITNFQNDYEADTDFIEVGATTIELITKEYAVADIPLLKLDIEGAELAVLERLANNGPYPIQILVEFDELARPSREVRIKYEKLHNLLLGSGYRCVHWDGYSDYSYERRT